MNGAEIAAELGGRRSGDGWLCRCPLADEHSHGDQNPSFTVVERDGKVLVRCQSRHADEQDRVIDALRARGLWPINENGKRQPARASRTNSNSSTEDQWESVSPIPDDAPDSDISAKRLYSKIVEKGGEASRFDYLDLDGRRLFSVYRFEPPSTPKEIRPLSLWRDRKTGALCWRAKWPPAPLPLFGLERLSKYQADAPVLLCEGEKKTELAADALGEKFVVLSIPSGAKSIDRIDDLSRLDGRRVCLWPDNDRVGFEAMTAIARKLEQREIARDGRITHSVEIVRPDAAWPAGHDVGDLVDAGWDANKLVEYVAQNSIGVDAFEQHAHERFFEGATPAVAESEVDRLAKLSALEYDRARKDAAKQMGVRPATLDAEVAKLRPKPEVTQEHESLAPAAPEPWAEPVRAAAILSEVRQFVKRFIVVEESVLITIVLWIAFTYFFEIAETSPRLAILSPTKRCGKTRVLELLLMLSPRAIGASNLSPPAVFRVIDLEHPTLVIDEADTWNADRNNELRGILNSGHTRSTAYIIRSVPVGDKAWEPKRFSTWCAVAMAAIGKLPETWLDRSIVIRMSRKSPGVKVERLTQRNSAAREQAAQLQRKLGRLAADNLEAVRDSTPPLPELASDRAIDNWEHLLAIAELGGANWVAKARSAAVTLSGDENVMDGDSLGEVLIRDLAKLFAEDPSRTALPSTEICKALIELEDHPWAEFGKTQKPLTPPRLAWLLKSFGVRPKTCREGDATFKGYETESFAKIFQKYSIPPESNRHTVTTAVSVGESDDFQSVTESICDGSKNCVSSYGENECDGVTAQKAGNGEDQEISDPEEAEIDPEERF